MLTLASLVAWFVLHHAPDSSSTTWGEAPGPDGAYTIEVGATGFVPDQLDIPVGARVRFINTHTEPRWPASDPHPIHSDHPDLDPKQELQPGESWEFVFTQAGTYRMHDHLAALYRATIVVGGSDTLAATPIEPVSLDSNPCQETTTDTFNCYEQFYTALVLEKGIPTALAQVKQEYTADGYARSQCHPIMHVIGHAAAKRFPDVGEAFAQGDGFCWSGYYHGVMETIVSTVPKEAILDRINSICTTVPGKERQSFDYYNCVHGLGHGVMAMTGNQLFEALGICEKLEGGWEQSSCYGGVFMENVMIDNKNHFTQYLKPAEPLYPCTAVAEPYKPACWLMQTSYMLKVTGGDFAQVFALCQKADAGYVDTCLQSLGRDASGSTVSDPVRTREICLMGPDTNARVQCTIGAVKDFVSYHHSDTQAKALCATLPTEIHHTCLSTVENYYQSF